MDSIVNKRTQVYRLLSTCSSSIMYIDPATTAERGGLCSRNLFEAEDVGVAAL